MTLPTFQVVTIAGRMETADAPPDHLTGAVMQARRELRAMLDGGGWFDDPQASKASTVYPACQGANCGATDGRSHSAECHAEHDAACGVAPFDHLALCKAAQAAGLVVDYKANGEVWLLGRKGTKHSFTYPADRYRIAEGQTPTTAEQAAILGVPWADVKVWIAATKVGQPVADDVVVEVKYADGSTRRATADDCWWGDHPDEPSSNVIAYRLIPE